jgi:hypothetical protein
MIRLSVAPARARPVQPRRTLPAIEPVLSAA